MRKEDIIFLQKMSVNLHDITNTTTGSILHTIDKHKIFRIFVFWNRDIGTIYILTVLYVST